MAINNLINEFGKVLNKLTLSVTTIKVEPQALRNQSTEVSNMIKVLKDAFDDIQKQVKSSTLFWNGEAAEEFRNRYLSYSDEISEIISRFTEHVGDLNTIAGTYETTESQAAQAAAVLPDEVII